jgi:hypothetical protein
MKPVSSNIKPNNKCLNPVTTKCVTWDGPDITCLDGTTLCKGQTIENTVYLLASKLCLIYESIGLEGLNTCINNIQDGTSVSVGSNSTLKEVFSAIINKVCTLNTRVETLENTDCPEIRAVVPACLINDTTLPVQVESFLGWDSTNNTLPIESYASYVAQIICFMLIKITTIQNQIISINQAIQDLWDALNSCTNNCSFNVQPTCTNDFTLNPTNQPVFISDAYQWLEADFCQLQSAVGTPAEITNAINKQCANLGEQDKLSSGGVMENTAGWVNNPVTLADSLSNMWLTVCDMRQAVKQILDGCCFSLCNYLEFGYDITWSVDGTSIEFSLNTPGSQTVYTSANVPPDPNYPAAAGVPLLAWVLTQFPTAFQSNIIITFDDGVGTQAIWPTSVNLNTLAVAASPLSFSFPSGYSYTSNQQTINISFTYVVDDQVTPPVTCEINQTDSLPYECCSPPPAPYDWAYDISSTTGSDMTIIVRGLEESTGVVYPTSGTANPTGIGANTLTDTAATFLAAWATADYGYIVRITSGPGAGQVRYITGVNLITFDELTVNQNWDTPLPDVTSTYEIQDIYWPFPLNGPDYPCGVSSPDPSPLLSLKVQVIEIDSGYNPNDPNTWNIQVQQTNVTDAAILSGITIPDGTLNPNTDYAVAVFAEYACDFSEPTIYDVITPISGSVVIEFGTQTAPAANVFNSATTTVIVDNITSNALAPNIPDASVIQSNPALFALTLPVGANQTRFQVIPNPAAWNTTQGILPRSYSLCGLNYDPWGTSGAPLNTPNRDIALGQYRGYEVELIDMSNPLSPTPILDACGIPFKTNSLDDPNLVFIYNQPFGFSSTCPSPAVPLCTPAPPAPTCSTAGKPITIDIPSTYPSNFAAVKVRYNPNPYKVNLSDDFHKVTIKSGSKLTIVNNAISSLTITGTELFFYAHIYKYDPTTQSYVDYSTPIYNTFTTGSQTLAPGASYSTTLLTDQSVSCKYGDAMYCQLTYDKTVSSYGSNCFIGTAPSLAPLVFGPAATSQFSCNIPSPVIKSFTNSGTQLPINSANPAERITSYKYLITEDLEISFDVYVIITTP